MLSAACYESVLNTSPNGLIILDKEGMILEANQAARDLFEKSDLANTSIELLVDSNDIKRFEKIFNQATKVGNQHVGRCIHMIRGGGKAFFAEVHFSLLECTDKKEDPCIICKVNDLLETGPSNSIFASSLLPMTLITLEGIRVECNAAMEELTGKQRNELLDVPFEDNYPEEEREKVKKVVIKETIQKGSVKQFETHLVRNNELISVLVQTSLVRDNEGRPMAIIYSATNISLIEKREKELECTMSIFSDALNRIKGGDIRLDLDTSRIPEAYKPISHYIEQIVCNLKDKEEALGLQYEYGKYLERLLNILPIGYLAYDPDSGLFVDNDDAIQAMLGVMPDKIKKMGWKEILAEKNKHVLNTEYCEHMEEGKAIHNEWL